MPGLITNTVPLHQKKQFVTEGFLSKNLGRSMFIFFRINGLQPGFNKSKYLAGLHDHFNQRVSKRASKGIKKLSKWKKEKRLAGKKRR